MNVKHEGNVVDGPRICNSEGCENKASGLQCPTCLKQGIKVSFFCSQDCFKRNWGSHKLTHKSKSTGNYNPFPSFPFTGQLRPCYPLSPKRSLPEKIRRPDYADDGVPKSEQRQYRSSKIKILDSKEIAGVKKVSRLAREVLDLAASHIKPGVTTDFLDEVVHNACIERDSYPSPLNYSRFPKSVCTSLNEVICHGIPDQRSLEDGDIVNIDVTLYHGGFHGDLNETYYVGDKARQDRDTVRLVETARQCLDIAIQQVKPGVAFRDFGAFIEKHAKSRGCSVVKTYTGHVRGNPRTFSLPAQHPPLYVDDERSSDLHIDAKNKAVGTAKAGMVFTIEPMINLGSHRDLLWPDNWTSTTSDGKKSAQFEHTLLVTEDGVEVLTARQENSPGGAIEERRADEVNI